MANLLTEVWPGILIGDKDKFFENETFLSHGRNMNAFVENDRINFAYKGGRPGVTKNFRTDGTTKLPIFQRTDIPDYVDMDNYSTDVVQLPKVDLYALPYDKWSSLLDDSRAALQDRIATEGLWNIGPAANAAKTPIVTTADGNAEADDGYEGITEVELKALRVKLDKQYPGRKNAEWFLVVDVSAYWQMVNTIAVLKEQWYRQTAGNVFSDLPMLKLYNFMIWADDRTPWYKASDSTKYAYGAAYTVDTDFKSAVAYVRNETFVTGLGTTEVFDNLRDPETQSDMASFLTRAYIGPWGKTTANLELAGAILRKP